MVELVLENVDQISLLELELLGNGIPYRLVEGKALKPPYLVVFGVPLDFERSMKWIKEHTTNE